MIAIQIDLVSLLGKFNISIYNTNFKYIYDLVIEWKNQEILRRCVWLSNYFVLLVFLFTLKRKPVVPFFRINA